MTEFDEPKASGERVSVVIPVRDRLDLVTRAIGTVRAQTTPVHEIIVVDDASKQPLAPGLEALAEPRLRVLRNEANGGGGYSRRRGALAATGDYVAFLDSDDSWNPKRIEVQLRAARRQPDDRFLIISRTRMLVRQEVYITPSVLPEPGEPMADYIYARGGLTPTSTLLLPATLAQEITFDPDLRVNQETDYVLRLERAGVRIVFLPDALADFDATPRADRITHDATQLERSTAWFERVSTDWSPLARRGYYLRDTVQRATNADRRGIALRAFLRGSHPAFGLRIHLRQFAYLVFKGPAQIRTRLQRRLRPAARAVAPARPDR